MAVSIVVVEDDQDYRENLSSVIRHTPWCELEASFEDATLAVAEAKHLPQWDLVLMDLHLPKLGGVQAIAMLKEVTPKVPVVALTMIESPHTILAAIQAGADGYLLKDMPLREILITLRTVTEGGSPLTPSVANLILRQLRGARPIQQGPLSPREHQVLQLLAKGFSYKQVAYELSISTDTVRTYIRSLYKKLQVHSVSEAVGLAIRTGLVL